MSIYILLFYYKFTGKCFCCSIQPYSVGDGASDHQFTILHVSEHGRAPDWSSNWPPLHRLQVSSRELETLEPGHCNPCIASLSWRNTTSNRGHNSITETLILGFCVLHLVRVWTPLAFAPIAPLSPPTPPPPHSSGLLSVVFLLQWRRAVCTLVLHPFKSQRTHTRYDAILYFITWLTDFACCDWSIPGP